MWFRPGKRLNGCVVCDDCNEEVRRARYSCCGDKLQNQQRGTSMTPLRYAAILTLGYVAVAAAYILVSSEIAAAASQDVHDLKRLESVSRR